MQPISFNRGFYTVDVRYFYRITADAFVGACRPVEVTGLAVFDKRVILFGSEGSAKVFTSDDVEQEKGCHDISTSNLPTAVVESVDPLILSLKLVDVCECHHHECACNDIPEGVAAAFSEEIMTSGDVHRLYATLGQFSIVRLERDTQVLIPVYDYCMPEKECTCSGGECQVEDPCELFRKVQFPVNEFFPPNSVLPRGDSYQEARSIGCRCN